MYMVLSMTYSTAETVDPVRSAYGDLAAFYDIYKATDDYSRAAELILGQVGEIDPAESVLDAATGTGNFALQLAQRGISVDGFDVSSQMVAAAAGKRSLGRSRLWVADMRDVPSDPQRYRLITCWDDAINYLLTDDDLCLVLANFRKMLMPGGAVVFDLNTASTYQSLLSEPAVERTEQFVFTMKARYTTFCPGQAHVLDFDVEHQSGLRALTTEHRQRHFEYNEVATALEAAGFTGAASFGVTATRFVPTSTEEGFHKLVWVARSPE